MIIEESRIELSFDTFYKEGYNSKSRNLLSNPDLWDGRCTMSQKIVESVQAIENQAQQLKEDFQKKIDEAKIQANQKISESKKNVEIALLNYEKELEDKYSQKKLDFQEELSSLQKEEIQQIQQVFEANRQELVQETIKEVLKRYGNC